MSIIFLSLFLIFIGIEWFFSVSKKDGIYNTGETSSNLITGVGVFLLNMSTSDLIAYVVVSRVHEIMGYVTIYKFSLLSLVLCFVLYDFISYFSHVIHHKIPFLWMFHVVHHSDTHFNTSTHLRTSVFHRVYMWIFSLPLYFLFHPALVIFSKQISNVYQFFVHSQYIYMPRWVENVFVTPSSHLVHHGRNKGYLDKNFGQVFTVWDKLFKTHVFFREKVLIGVIDYPKMNVFNIQYIPIKLFFKKMAKRFMSANR